MRIEIPFGGCLVSDTHICPPEDAGYVLASLSRLPDVTSFSWEEGHVTWSVEVPKGEEECAHQRVRSVVHKALTTHAIVR
jgi:hypothetical protein